MHTKLGLGLFTSTIAAAAAAVAHHSPAAFDFASEVVIEGTITELDWRNPHVYFTVATADTSARAVLQQVEVGPLSAVQTYGLKREMLAVGSHVIVRANPNRGGTGRVVRGLDVTTDDGQIHALTDRGRNSERPAVVPAAGLAGNWVPSPSAFGALVRAAQTWPLTDAGRAARAKAQTTPTSLGLCEAFPPPALTTLPELRTIEVSAATVVMRFDAEGVDVVRTIHLDQASHPVDLAPSIQGHSIGRWDGEALIVDTADFRVHPAGLGMGLPSGPGKHLTERLTLTANRLQLEYSFTVEDPGYLAAPVSYTMLWDHRPDLEHSGVACDPEIARRFLAPE